MPSKNEGIPGFQCRPRKDGSVALYWVASRAAIAAGYEPKTVRLHFPVPNPDPAPELSRRCQDLQAQMERWLIEQSSDADKPIVFNGTLGSLIRVYEENPDSPFHEKGQATQRNYSAALKTLRNTVGERRLSSLNGLDFRRWYKRFREPREGGGPERISSAHYIMTMLRLVLSFGDELSLLHAKRLRDVLHGIRFADAPPRTQQITSAQVADYIAQAHELGYPEMALAQTFQFEGTFRQTDVIGKWEWRKDEPTVLEWNAGIVWSEITTDRILTHKTSKRGRVVRLDLKECPLIVAELDRLPRIPRIGALIIDSKTGKPFKYDDYARRWREIARKAGIPDDVWNRDSRAGGVTEGLDAGADIEDVRHQAGHANINMTRRYDRDSLDKTTRVSKARVKYRNKT